MNTTTLTMSNNYPLIIYEEYENNNYSKITSLILIIISSLIYLYNENKNKINLENENKKLQQKIVNLENENKKLQQKNINLENENKKDQNFINSEIYELEIKKEDKIIEVLDSDESKEQSDNNEQNNIKFKHYPSKTYPKGIKFGKELNSRSSCWNINDIYFYGEKYEKINNFKIILNFLTKEQLNWYKTKYPKNPNLSNLN